MKKLLIALALFVSAETISANPGTGGYLGHRIIVGVDGSYSPFFTSFKDFYTKYNFQYGGNLNFIVGRYSQIGVTYNRYSLNNNQLFEGNFSSKDRVNGSAYGITFRKFRKSRGGLAPIGKFWDVGVTYSQNTFKAGSDNQDVLNHVEFRLPVSSDIISAHVSFGTQMVFRNRLVANTGIRFGAPLVELGNSGGTDPTMNEGPRYYSKFMYQRMLYKEAFSVFFGLGILI